MAEGEPIEELFVRMGYDAGSWLDDYEADIKKAVDIGKEAGQEIGAALSEGISENWGQNLAETATKLGVSLQEVAHTLVETGNAAGKTEEELIGLARAYQIDLIKQFESAMKEAEVEVSKTGEVSQETAHKMEALLAQMKKANSGMDELRVKSKEGSQAQGLLGKAVEVVAGKMGPMGGIVKQVGGALVQAGVGAAAFVAAGAVLALGLKELIDLLDEAYKAAIRFTEINFRLNVAVRVLQAEIGKAAGSIEEWQAQAKEISKTLGVDSTAVEALQTKVINLGKGIGLTKDQMMAMVEAAAILSKTTGVDAVSAATLLSRYVQFGMSRSLISLGISISQAQLQAAAFSLGIRKSMKEMTPAERQAVRYAAAMEEIAKRSALAAEGQKTVAGAINQANVDLGNAIEGLGVTFAVPLSKITVAWIKFRTLLVQGVTVIVDSLIKANMVFEAFVQGLEAFGLAFTAAFVKTGNVITSFRAALDAFWKVSADGLTAALKETEAGLGNLGNEYGKGATEAEGWAADSQAAFDEVSMGMDDLVKDYEEAASKIEDKFYKKLADIDADFGKDLTKAAQKLGQDLADIDADAARSKADAIYQSNVEELRMAQDHAIAMKQLEQSYLLDLEDAVRERDARQVLLLQRRHNIEKQQAEEAYQLAQKRREEDLKRELEAIERERELRRAERRQEYLEELAQIQAKEAEKRALAEEARKQELAELQAAQAELIKQTIDGINEAGALSAGALSLLANKLGELAATSSGELAQIAQAAYQYVVSLAQAAAAMAAALGGQGGQGMQMAAPGVWTRPAGAGGNVISGTPVIGHAMGADFVATGPQMIRVGERPERVTVTPLNTGTGGALSQAGFGGGPGGGGKLQVNLGIRLSPGLEAEMLDKAMSEVADVIVSMTKGEPAGFGGAARPGGRQ